MFKATVLCMGNKLVQNNTNKILYIQFGILNLFIGLFWFPLTELRSYNQIIW